MLRIKLWSDHFIHVMLCFYKTIHKIMARTRYAMLFRTNIFIYKMSKYDYAICCYFILQQQYNVCNLL